MKIRKLLNKKRIRRSRRVRKHIRRGADTKPRISVFRSNLHIYTQLIDDVTGKTLASSSSLEFKGAKVKMSKTAIAKEIGKSIAGKAMNLKINSAVFDRGKYRYHGRVKAMADGIRESGLKI